MKKMILAVAIIFTLALFTASWQVLAQDESVPPSENTIESTPEDDPMPIPGPEMQEMMKELGITEEQITAMQNARSAHMKEMIEINAKLKVAQIELRDLMREFNNDDAVVAKHNEIKEIMSQISDLRVQHHLSQRSIFTAEQWEKVSKAFGTMRAHRNVQNVQHGVTRQRHPRTPRGWHSHDQRPNRFHGRMQRRDR